MYVCICHAITDADVVSAEKSGATEEIEVFRHCGVKPQCGRCLQSMRCLLKERRSEGSRDPGSKPADQSPTSR